MAVKNDYWQYVLEQLRGLGDVTSRRMFGGVGLYHEGRFFAIIMRDTLYFKVDDSSRRDYQARGMAQFRPFPDRPQSSATYYEVPADILEDAEECVAWARSASIATTARSAPARSAPARPSAPRARKRRRRR